MTIVPILICLISVFSFFSLSLGAPTSNITIHPNDPSVRLSSEWQTSQQNGSLITYVNAIGASLKISLPNGATSVSYKGYKKSGGAAYGVCVDCDKGDKGFFDKVDGNDPSKNATQSPTLLFKISQLDPSSPHTISVFNLADERFGNTSQLTFDSLDVAVVNNINGASAISSNKPPIIVVPSSSSGNTTGSSPSGSGDKSSNSSQTSSSSASGQSSTPTSGNGTTTGSASPKPSGASSSSSQKSKLSPPIIAAVVILCILALLAILLGIFVFMRTRSKDAPVTRRIHDAESVGPPMIQSMDFSSPELSEHSTSPIRDSYVPDARSVYPDDMPLEHTTSSNRDSYLSDTRSEYPDDMPYEYSTSSNRDSFLSDTRSVYPDDVPLRPQNPYAGTVAPSMPLYDDESYIPAQPFLGQVHDHDSLAYISRAPQ